MSSTRTEPPSDFGEFPSSPKTKGQGASARSAGIQPKSEKKLWIRRIVLGVVALVTGVVMLTGFVWIDYRWNHVVIADAMVKGRVHRIGARLDGQVKNVEVEPGQHVTKGQVLFRLEDEHCVAAAREAAAQVQSAQKRLEVEKLAIEQSRQQLALDVEHAESVSAAAVGDFEAATSLRDKWEREYERAAALIKSGYASVTELDSVTAERDNARALARAAQARQTAAEAQRRLARAEQEGLKVREAGLEVLAADLDLARQHHARTEADVNATVMRAPADGWVIERIVEAGGSAKVGEPMMSLWLGAPWIEAWVNEKKLARIKIGSHADVTLAAYPGCKLRGSVIAIGVLADKQLQASSVPGTLHAAFVRNAMVPIRISVPSSQIRLQPGLTALVGVSDTGAKAAAPQADLRDGFLEASLVLAGEPSKEEHEPSETNTKPN
jgi:membrane fusion protein (multidrug efflux system)